jgi:hypothetical protein
MHRSFNLRRSWVIGLALLAASACGGGGEPAAEKSAAAETKAASQEAQSPAREAAAAPDEPSPSQRTAAPGLEGRTRELVNPEPLAMVLLYHDLAGTEPPFARWVEEDSRVTFVPAIEKQAARELVRAELEAALAAVRGVGALRISLGAELSDYDPTYGEFTIRALAPSRIVTFDAHREHVELRFANGLEAQVWKVPAADAQLVRDKVGQFQGASLDVLLRILELQPGGTIVTEVVEYEMRVQRTAELLARVRVVR